MAKKAKRRKKTTKTAAKTAAGSGSTTVPRARVGAAVQAAISLEGAAEVTAIAIGAAAAEFEVRWRP